MLSVVQIGRAAAAASAVTYVPAVLEETNQDAAAAGVVSTARILETTHDGRLLTTLLDEAPIQAKIAVQGGATATEALEKAGTWLTGVLLTVMADTSRDVVAADIAQRPAIGGYVRMLNPPSCRRCVILAGRFYRWNQGFQRHPRCDCRHIPATENIAGDLRTDPYAYFNSLTPDEQKATFGRIEARAIRDGADIYRTVNIGQRGLSTGKMNRRFGTPNRMTLDDIYRQAGTRTNAIRLMEREGFITGRQVAGGNVVGNVEGFGALGRGGTRSAASDAVLRARTTGTRDPLNRYTMTASERRLYDAKVRLDIGRTGVQPRSIGRNSADIYANVNPITPAQLARLEEDLRVSVANLANEPTSVRELARLLGLI